MTDRRTFIAGLGAAAAWPLAARAQQGGVPVLGFLVFGSAGSSAAPAFVEGLRESGYVVGQTVKIENRWAETASQLPALAADLIRLRPAVIFASGSAAALASKAATATIPIVFAIGDDPVRLGLVASLDRPGGNLTGTTNVNIELEGKRLAMMDLILPAAVAVGALVDTNNPAAERQAHSILEAAERLGRKVQILRAASESDIDDVFTRIKQERLGGLFVAAGQYFATLRSQIVTLATHYSIPTFFSRREFADAGGLVSYGTEPNSMLRQEASYIGRILKGERPADLPIVQPTKFELVVNLKTARRLGFTFPAAILALADEVIE